MTFLSAPTSPKSVADAGAVVSDLSNRTFDCRSKLEFDIKVTVAFDCELISVAATNPAPKVLNFKIKYLGGWVGCSDADELAVKCNRYLNVEFELGPAVERSIRQVGHDSASVSDAFWRRWRRQERHQVPQLD